MTAWADPARFVDPDPVRVVDPWPKPMAEAAFRGLAGEYVDIVAEDSEADPAALLATFLTVFGVMVGREPFARVRASRHDAALFVMIVGTSGSPGGKGQSWDPAGDLLHRMTNPPPQVVSGLGSGEGLIHAVRDPIMKIDKNGHEVVVDPGVEDKRALVLEVELGRLLRVAERQGSTVLPILRAAWDGHDLRSTTKSNSETATAPHIGIVVHVTPADLRRELHEAELVNGTMNRFLLIASKRPRIVADPAPLAGPAWEKLCNRVEIAAASAAGYGWMHRSDEATERWFEIVEELERERIGLFASIAGRARAQVVRLSLVYALLDGARVIEPEHLDAAVAVWNYAEDSARYVFAGSLGSEAAERILVKLDDVAPAGLALTDIHDLFGRNARASEIRVALNTLVEQRLVRTETVRPGASGGRPRQVWYSIDPEHGGAP